MLLQVKENMVEKWENMDQVKETQEETAISGIQQRKQFHDYEYTIQRIQEKTKHIENAGDTGRYQIDYILVKNRFKNKVKSCKIYPGADCDSDHQLVSLKFCVKLKKIVKIEIKQTNYNLEELKKVEVVEDLKKNMGKIYNNKEERKEPIYKKWQNI